MTKRYCQYCYLSKYESGYQVNMGVFNLNLKHDFFATWATSNYNENHFYHTLG